MSKKEELIRLRAELARVQALCTSNVLQRQTLMAERDVLQHDLNVVNDRLNIETANVASLRKSLDEACGVNRHMADQLVDTLAQREVLLKALVVAYEVKK